MHTHTYSVLILESLIHALLIHFFIPSVTHSVIHSYNAFIRLFSHWLTDLLTSSWMRSLIHSFIHSLTCWFIHFFNSIIHSLKHCLTHSLLHSFIPSLIDSPIRSFAPSCIRTFILPCQWFHLLSCHVICVSKAMCSLYNLCTSQPWPYIASAFHRHTFRPLIQFLIDIALLETSAPARPGTTGIFTEFWAHSQIERKSKNVFGNSSILLYIVGLVLLHCLCPSAFVWQRSVTDSSACWGKFPATAGYRFSRWTKILTMHCLLCFTWGIFASAWTPVQISLIFWKGSTLL